MKNKVAPQGTPLVYHLQSCRTRPQLTRVSSTWDEFSAMLVAGHTERDDKDGPGFVLAEMSKPYRAAANVARFDAVLLDMDSHGDTHPPAPDIAAEMLAASGLAGVVYTTHSHTDDAPRYRVVVPLAQSVLPADLQRVTRAAADAIGLTGEALDPKSWVVGQFFYLPSCRPDAPRFAACLDGAALVPPEAGDVVPVAPAPEPVPRTPLQAVRATPHRQGASVIDAFDAAHRITDTLARYGYKQMGARWLSPRSSSGIPGVTVFERDNRCFVHHSSDPLYGGDGKQPRAPFDFFCEFEHEGDIRAATRAAADLLGMGRERAAPVARPAVVVDDAPDWVDVETGEIHGVAHAAPAEEMPRALLMSVDDMLADCVWIAQGEQVAMLSRPGAAWSWSEFRNLTAASKTEVKADDDAGEGKKKKPRAVPNAVIWHNSPERITVDSRTFRPGHGAITARPGVDPASGLLAVNSWRPIRRGRGGADISLFLDHLAYLFPDAVERGAFFDWLAHLEQRPGELPHYGWLHIAEKTGTGRNWLSSLLGRIWAGYVASSVDLPALLDSQFNGQLAGRVLAVVDEIREGGGESVYKHANRLKSLINQETREINPKYGRQYTEYNALRWLVYSNHLEAIPMDETDRRWRVAMHTAAPRPESAYSALYAALDDPAFVDSVAVWLGARDISGFNPGARPPMTVAKQTAIHATMSAAQQYAREIVARWPSDVITSADAAEILADHADGDPRKPAMVPHYRRSMEEAGAVAVGKVIKVGGNPHRCWVIRNHGQWVGALPGVVASEALRARSGRGTHATARFVLVDAPAL